jgi:hypothetical protein
VLAECNGAVTAAALQFIKFVSQTADRATQNKAHFHASHQRVGPGLTFRRAFRTICCQRARFRIQIALANLKRKSFKYAIYNIYFLQIVHLHLFVKINSRK